MNRVFAQVNINNLRPARNINSFTDIVNLVVKNAVVIAGVVAFILLVLGGLGVIMGAGSGDTKGMEKGKKTITGAVIGLILIVMSVWIMQLIQTITGLDLPFLTQP
jgi:hypothetical protein